MSAIPVVWQSYRSQTPNRGYWDYAMVPEDLLAHRLWQPPHPRTYTHLNSISELPADADGAIIVLPARHHAEREYVHCLNADIARLAWVIVMLIGDEENSFPAHLIAHPNSRLWIQMAKPGLYSFPYRPLPNGYTPHTRLLDNYALDAVERPIDWFFSGQCTHPRREQCVEQLRRMPGGMRVETDGFTKGLPPPEYMRMLASAKIALAPSGPQSPDSFRLYEALEAGCVPIADAQTSKPGFPDGYWPWIFGGPVPFPVISDWRSLPEVMARELADWPDNANRIAVWWKGYKRKLVFDLEEDIWQLRGAL